MEISRKKEKIKKHWAPFVYWAVSFFFLLSSSWSLGVLASGKGKEEKGEQIKKHKSKLECAWLCLAFALIINPKSQNMITNYLIFIKKRDGWLLLLPACLHFIHFINEFSVFPVRFFYLSRRSWRSGHKRGQRPNVPTKSNDDDDDELYISGREDRRDQSQAPA